jgi:hypothetical protein
MRWIQLWLPISLRCRRAQAWARHVALPMKAPLARARDPADLGFGFEQVEAPREGRDRLREQVRPEVCAQMGLRGGGWARERGDGRAMQQWTGGVGDGIGSPPPMPWARA